MIVVRFIANCEARPISGMPRTRESGAPWPLLPRCEKCISAASNYASVNSINRAGIPGSREPGLKRSLSRPRRPNRELRSRATAGRDVATSSVTRRLINFLCNSILRQSSRWRWRFVALPHPPSLPRGTDKGNSRHRGIVDLIKTRLCESFLVEKQRRHLRRIPSSSK